MKDSSMLRSSGKQQAKSAAKCDHGDALNPPISLILLQIISTAESTDAFRGRCVPGQLSGLRKLVDLCADERCSHFKRSFIDDLWPFLCKAATRMLQLLHSSTGSFQQESEEVLQDVSALLGSLYACMKAINADEESSELSSSKARLDRLLAAVTAPGGCLTGRPGLP